MRRYLAAVAIIGGYIDVIRVGGYAKLRTSGALVHGARGSDISGVWDDLLHMRASATSQPCLIVVATHGPQRAAEVVFLEAHQDQDVAACAGKSRQHAIFATQQEWPNSNSEGCYG